MKEFCLPFSALVSRYHQSVVAQKCQYLPFISLLLFAALFISNAAASSALAGIALEAPGKVARGDAFLAKAVSDKAVDNMAFFWRGKTYMVKARPEGGGYAAEILLPAPLDEPARKLVLGAGPELAKGERPLATVHADINLFEKKRPVQKLTVDKKYVNPPASEKARIQRDREKVREALAQKLPEKEWSLPFARPVPGSVSSLFGMKRVFNGEPRSVHRGLDLRGAAGTPIKACADGRVALVDNLYFSGNTVYVNHGDGVFTAYLHMSETKAKTGDMVKKGDVIGLVGATGRVTGPHLHLSLMVQGQPVDPQPLLDGKK